VAELRVVDTSPLVYLSRAGLLELLSADAESVLVPQPVVDEILGWPTAIAAENAIHSFSWLAIAPPDPIPPKIIAWDLGKGESAVLAYGLNHPDCTLILDDLAARRCTAAFGLPVRGTLGLVLNAKKRGQLPSARSTLTRLRDAGMYLSDTVADAALREIGE
jgi:predicted nucleic acid-binding protein